MPSIKRAGLLFDVHLPAEDKKAYALALDVLEDLQVDELILGGDFLDAYGVNAHGKDPGISYILKDEVEYARGKLHELSRRFKKSKRVFLQGNHEFRIERYINQKAPELYGLVDTEDLLCLKHHGFSYIPYGPYQAYNVLGSSLIARHESLAGGIHCAHASVMKAHKSIIFGHHHRCAESQVVSFSGEEIRGISVGGLCNKYDPVMSYVKTHPQWQLGFAIITTYGNTWFCQNIQIIDYQCLVDGHIYQG